MIEKKGKSYREFAPLSGLGIQMAATIGAMVWFGYWLDSKLDTKPWLLIFFALFGSFAGLYNFIKTVLSVQKKNNDKKSG